MRSQLALEHCEARVAAADGEVDPVAPCGLQREVRVRRLTLDRGRFDGGAYDLGLGGADTGFGAVLVLTLILAIPLAAVSYYVVERPLMRLKYRSLREVLGGRRLRRTPSGARPG